MQILGSDSWDRSQLLIAALMCANMIPWRMNCRENTFPALSPPMFNLWQVAIVNAFRIHSYYLKSCREAFIRPSRGLNSPEWRNNDYFWCSHNIVSMASRACYKQWRVFQTLQWTASFVKSQQMLHYTEDIAVWWILQYFGHLLLYYWLVLGWGMLLKIMKHVLHWTCEVRLSKTPKYWAR